MRLSGSDRLRLTWVLGQRAFWAFGLLTLLVVALLAATNITSRYALKSYTESQLARVPWDVTLYQLQDMPSSARIPGLVRALPEVQRVETIHFLRTTLPQGATLEVDGQPLRTPWVSLLTSTDVSLLPPEVGAAAGRAQGPVLGLLGPERHMGEAFKALQGTTKLAVTARLSDEHEEGDGHAHGEIRRLPEGLVGTLFSIPFERVVRLEREELNRWFMDRTGAISFIPAMGVVLATPHDQDMVKRFDELSRGVMEEGEGIDIHAQAGGYLPEAIHLIRADRDLLVSGWDLERSRQNVAILVSRVERQAGLGDGSQGTGDSGREEIPGPQSSVLSPSGTLFVASDSLLLLDRMIAVARVLGVLTILIALPLLWMAWVLAGNLVGLLMLNERRTMGLMRLRGASGEVMGQSFVLAIGFGGALGGLVGMALGTAIPSLIYEGSMLPWDLLVEVQNPLVMLLFLAVGVGFALVVSRRLVSYATTISPREAAGRLATSESGQVQLRFGPFQALALGLGAYRIAGWITGLSLGAVLDLPPLRSADSLLDFAALPLFIYGVSTWLVSRQRWLRRLLHGMTAILGGRLRDFTLNHTAAKPHRVASILLVTALVAGVTLYPSIAASSFEDKALRGTRVQLGSEINLTLNAPELAQADLKGGVREQVTLLRPKLLELSEQATRVDGVASVQPVYEALLPHFYMPGHGFTGIPLYLVDQPARYLTTVYSEDALGRTASFRSVVAELAQGKVLVSPSVSEFFDVEPGKSLFVGLDESKQPVILPVGGVITTLPGMPQKSVEDRDTYLSAEVDYLNHLFSTSAYLVAAADNPRLAGLQVLIPRVSLLTALTSQVDPTATKERLLATLPVRPLEARDLPTELAKTGQDMFISLALANLRVYLLGGLLLAIIGITAVALVNYLEDRRTLGLLRVRGAAPHDLLRFFASSLLSPTILGIGVGALVGLVGGYGFSDLIWSLRKVLMVVLFLPTQLIVPPASAITALVVLLALCTVSVAFSLWVFRRSAREGLGG